MSGCSLDNLPKRNWGKKLWYDDKVVVGNEGRQFRIHSVEPQAYLIGVTQPVGLLAGYSADAILVKAFEKNYQTPSRPGVVKSYGFEQKHGEPIELIDFVFECVYDRACEGEMNRYRHNSKNMESGRYVDYISKGLTIVFPDDVVSDNDRRAFIDDVVLHDLYEYAQAIHKGAKRQAARRRLGEYRAVEGVYKANLRSVMHMATQRSDELSPNGREAEPQISSVVTQMIASAIKDYVPHFHEIIMAQIAEGYR